MGKGPDFKDIRAALISRIDDVCLAYFGDGRKNGGYWIARNPARKDTHAGSFWIHLRHPVGAWKDASSGEQGDIIKLIGLGIGTQDLKTIRQEACRFLGWPTDGVDEDEAARKQRMAELAKRQSQRQIEAERENHNNRWSAFKLWQSATKLDAKNFSGSLAERYFLSRGINLQTEWLDYGRALPGAIAFFEAHDYRMADGSKVSGHPCLISLMSGADGKPAAVHRTWLAKDGLGKAEFPQADLNKPRKMWPSFAGTQAVVRVAKGAGNYSPEEAARQGARTKLVITEGIEDALSVMIACPDHRVWAATSLSNLAHVPVLPCVSSITVCADNDWDKPQAIAQLDTAIAALKRQNIPVFVARSWRGKDVNDLLAGKD